MVWEGVPALALQGAGDGQVVCAEFEGGVLRPLQGMEDHTKGTKPARRGKIRYLLGYRDDFRVV